MDLLVPRIKISSVSPSRPSWKHRLADSSENRKDQKILHSNSNLENFFKIKEKTNYSRFYRKRMFATGRHLWLAFYREKLWLLRAAAFLLLMKID